MLFQFSHNVPITLTALYHFFPQGEAFYVQKTFLILFFVFFTQGHWCSLFLIFKRPWVISLRKYNCVTRLLLKLLPVTLWITHRVIGATGHVPCNNVGHRKHLPILGLLNKNGYPSRDELTVKLYALSTSNKLPIRIVACCTKTSPK